MSSPSRKRSSIDMEDNPETAVDLQNPDELRPAKQAKLDAPLTVTEDTQQEMMDEDDWDEIYGNTENTGVPVPIPSERNITATTNDERDKGPTCTAPSAPHEHQYGVTEKKEDSKTLVDGIPAEAIDQGDDLVAPPPRPAPESSDQASVNVMEETTEIEYQPPTDAQVTTDGEVKMSDAEPADVQKGMPTQPAEGSLLDSIMADAGPSQPQPKATEDPEFMAAAAAQKGDPSSEWQFDSSDAESSSDSSDSSDDSSDDSDSGSEGGYEMLDPATAARILMSGDGDDDGDKGKDKNGGDRQPRTANEVQEEIVKPDVKITPEMKITHLGNVESVVENMILIKGATPGEYQVVEGGSVLCNEKREVIGAVSDTFGRVQEPLYCVTFNNAREIEEAGLTFGAKVYYVDSHSTFVFTQPLKNMKGTDASNIHDEEVGEDELEFSDDEAEAEFKRQRKAAKKAGRGGLTRSAFQSGARGYDPPTNNMSEAFAPGSASDVPMQTYGGGLSYDDDEPADDFYQPLKRPDNLSQMMAGGPPPPRAQPPSDRGRGGGRGRGDRGRGRGDRGRGRGGFDNRNQRGGRGGFQSQQDHGQRGGHHDKGNAHRGSAHSFPDRHNDRPSPSQQHGLPPKPNVANPLPPPPQPQYQQQAPQTYQFNGYTFQYGNAPPQQTPAPQYNYYAQQQQQNPAGTMPTGAHVNPAFFQQQAQYQQAQPPHAQAYAAWPGQQYQQQQYAQPQAGAGAQQPQQPGQPGQPGQPPANLDLNSILKHLGAQ